MARQFAVPGAPDYLNSAATVNLSTFHALTIAFWGWFDTSDTGQERFFQMGGGTAAGTIIITPNSATAGKVDCALYGNGGEVGLHFDKPTAAAWHWWCIQMNSDGTSYPFIDVTVDNAAVANPAAFGVSDFTAHTMLNDTPFIMSANGTVLQLAGRFGDLAIWGGNPGGGAALLSSADKTAVFGSHPTAASIQPNFYWPIQGRVSPEPATDGGIALTVHGTTYVDAHNGPEGSTGGPFPFFRRNALAGGMQTLSGRL